MNVAAVLLAAGRSARFGDADKLVAPLADLPLGFHAARTLSMLPLAWRFVVTGAAAIEWPGFVAVPNGQTDAGLGCSLALGAAAAERAGADAVLVALADMPFVPVEHFERLLAGYHGPDSVLATGDGTRRMPPALFGAGWFAPLLALSGDRGARTLLDRAELITTPAENLIDVDRPDDLMRAQAQLATIRS